MKFISEIACATLALTLFAGCEDSSTPPTTGAATQPSVTQKLEDAGRDLKDAATIAAEKAKPAATRLAQEGKEELHKLAQKINDATTTQPATNANGQ